jgi:hypothetical protein
MLAFISGCAAPPLPPVTLVAMIDVSGSTTGAKGIREQWSNELKNMLTPFSNDSPDNANFGRAASIAIGSMTGNSAASGQLIQRTLAPSQGLLGVQADEKDARAKAVNDCLSFVKQTLDAEASASDIMGAIDRSGKYFSPDAKSPQLLVLFSDMIEQTAAYDFTTENLTATRTKQIIESEKEENRLPNLHGVKVWISGFAAADQGGLPPAKIARLQDFWLAYFAATGADIDSSRIDRTLNNFTIPQK